MLRRNMPKRHGAILYRQIDIARILTMPLQIVFAAEVIFIVVVYLCKIAVILLLHRLASQRFKRTYAIAMIATCCAFCTASMLTIAIHGIGTPWSFSQNSAHQLVSDFIRIRLDSR
jgi:fatty-acid desaturase